MSELMAVGQALTMSSREIADLVDSRHDSDTPRVLVTVEEIACVTP